MCNFGILHNFGKTMPNFSSKTCNLYVIVFENVFLPCGLLQLSSILVRILLNSSSKNSINLYTMLCVSMCFWTVGFSKWIAFGGHFGCACFPIKSSHCFRLSVVTVGSSVLISSDRQHIRETVPVTGASTAEMAMEASLWASCSAAGCTGTRSRLWRDTGSQV